MKNGTVVIILNNIKLYTLLSLKAFFLLQETLYTTFSTYGLIYGTQLYPYSGQPVSDGESKTKAGGGGFYAFVTFYLAMAARKAKEELKSKIAIGNTECKVHFTYEPRQAKRALSIAVT